MKKLLIALLLLLTAFPALAAEKESAYDRVMRTQTIRCGYGTYQPWIYQDLASGEMKGFSVEVAKAMAAQLSLKLEWPEETGWGSMPESLYTGRVDVACSLLWIDPARARRVAYTRPLFYTPVYLYARADDTRFTGQMDEINNPDIKIITQEGDVTAALGQRYFPKAQSLMLPASAQWSELTLSVISKKADVLFSDPISAQNFNAAQEKKLKKIPLPAPITTYGSAFAVGIHDLPLKEVIDATAAYMIDNGVIDALATEFNAQYPGAVIPAPKSYEAPR